MRNIILHTKGDNLSVPVSGENYIENTREGLLGRLRKQHFDSIVAFCKEKPSSSFIRAIAQRAPLSALFIICENDFDPNWRESLLIDKKYQMPLSDDEISDFNRMLHLKSILAQSEIAGRSDAIYNIGRVIQKVSETDLAVFITGESGVGKELVARAIHQHSLRKDKRFLPVNSGAIPENLLEAELFGHTKGAFTGAGSAREGYFKQADGGTIFLDEIGELPQQSQVKLLRILESGEFFPVGSSRAEEADVRIVAATNQDVKELVKEGRFREDLYYRLGVVNIFIPPLRERPKDVLILIRHFQNQLENKYKKQFAGFDDSAIDGLLSYNFPGNARELRNLVENALLLAGKQQVEIDNLRSYFETHGNIGKKLPSILRKENYENADIMRIIGYIANELKSIRQSIDELNDKIENQSSRISSEEDRIEDALIQANGNKTEAAKILGMSRRTLYRKLDKYGIEI
ncbi:MAG: sigma-54 interaction domain-containing protein [Candidatus Zixiibacteriota bacterium]